MHFVYIKVPLQGTSDQTWDAMHLALEHELTAAGVGSLIGWGTSVPTVGAATDDPGSFHRIDIELQALEHGLKVLRETLASMKSPPGTELHFTAQGSPLQQSLSENGWGAEVPRSGAHRSGRPKDGA
jgi:hypothetical protein